MKVFYFFLISLFFLSFQNTSAQTVGSSIAIKKKGDTYFVSGIVPDERTKNRIIEKIKNVTAGNVAADKLKIDAKVNYPGDNWEEKLSKQVIKIKNQKNAYIQIRYTEDDSFPNMCPEILNAEIHSTENDNRFKLSDYKNGTVILTLIADWSAPDRITIAVLNQLYKEDLKNVKIIAVNIEDRSDQAGFRKFVKAMKIEFQTGWADKEFVRDLLNISKFEGVPQTFIMKNGKLRGVFLGASDKVNKMLIQTARKNAGE